MRVDGAGRHFLGDLVVGLFFHYRQTKSSGDGFVRG